MNENRLNIPLCVDLDGTLIATDSLLESTLILAKMKPWLILFMPFWILKGKTFFKNHVLSHVLPSPDLYPYRQDVLDFIKKEKEKGRRIVLATATVQPIADSIQNHLGIFDEVIGSSSVLNLRSSNKADELCMRFGEKGFDYAGDSKADFKVWEKAAGAIVVHAPNGIRKKAESFGNVIQVFERKQSFLKLFIKEIRVYQWLKNILIFLPLLMAHRIHEPILYVQAIIAFFVFSFAASSVYVLNDLMDLEADRLHPRKRRRPLASGEFSIPTAVITFPSLLLASLLLSFVFLPIAFSLTLIVYLCLTTAYSFVIKRVYILDIFLLSVLYTIRLLAGAESVGVPVSKWLLAFSVFIFLSLAIVKRYTELKVMILENRTKTTGRGYYVDDIGLLLNIGPASGYLAVLVFALYIYSPEVVHLYKHPEVLWLVAMCLMYWVTRIWFLAHRGKMTDDPIVFTSKDYVSYIVGLIIGLLVIGATL